MSFKKFSLIIVAACLLGIIIVEFGCSGQSETDVHDNIDLFVCLNMGFRNSITKAVKETSNDSIMFYLGKAQAYVEAQGLIIEKNNASKH